MWAVINQVTQGSGITWKEMDNGGEKLREVGIVAIPVATGENQTTKGYFFKFVLHLSKNKKMELCFECSSSMCFTMPLIQMVAPAGFTATSDIATPIQEQVLTETRTERWHL